MTGAGRAPRGVPPPTVAGPDVPTIRPAADSDSQGLIVLIGRCFAEYEGCVLDTESEMAHLHHVATHFAAAGGCAWIAEGAGSVVGSVAYRPATTDGGFELQMLYVSAPWRRRGLGSTLVALVESEALRRGGGTLELWSDTRFTDAHRLYRSLGYEQLAGTRELHDLSETIEHHFWKALGG